MTKHFGGGSFNPKKRLAALTGSSWVRKLNDEIGREMQSEGQHLSTNTESNVKSPEAQLKPDAESLTQKTPSKER